MTHLWVRAEERHNEQRVGLTPQGAAELLRAGFSVTVENSTQRAMPMDGFVAAGCATAAEGSWRQAPEDAIIFGLKELPEDGTPLTHRHIMFGHAYKGQPAGQELLRRFRAGGTGAGARAPHLLLPTTDHCQLLDHFQTYPSPYH